MVCPNCGCEAGPGAMYCPGCQVDFNKLARKRRRTFLAGRVGEEPQRGLSAWTLLWRALVLLAAFLLVAKFGKHIPLRHHLREWRPYGFDPRDRNGVPILPSAK